MNNERERERDQRKMNNEKRERERERALRKMNNERERAKKNE